MGLDIKNIKEVRNVRELWNAPPNLVSAQTRTNCNLYIDGSPMKLKKGQNLIMPLSFYDTSKRIKKDRMVVLQPSKKTFASQFKRYSGQNLDNKTLLIIRTGGIGDILFALPICSYFKTTYPTCKIIFASANKYQSIFNCFPPNIVDSSIMIPFDAELLNKTDYHLSFEGAIERNAESRRKHAFDIFAEMAGLKIDFEKFKTRLLTLPELDEEIKYFIPQNYVIIQMKASSRIRMMSSFKWADLIRRFGVVNKDINFVLLDSTNSHTINEEIVKLIVDGYEFLRPRIFNLCKHSLSIAHAISIINSSRGVIGIDSSMNHIAGALNKPMLGLFAPFNAKLRLKYYDNSDWVQSKKSVCPKFPCFFHGVESEGCEYCSRGESPICMNEINNDEIVEKFKLVFK